MNSNLQKIDHVVVLMLENRSFDNMLGWLGSSDRGRQKVNEVAGKGDQSHPRLCQTAARTQIHFSRQRDHHDPSQSRPGEEYPHVNTQLFGKIIPKANQHAPFNVKPYNLPSGKLPDPAPMNGFVRQLPYNFINIRKRMPRYDEYKITS